MKKLLTLFLSAALTAVSSLGAGTFNQATDLLIPQYDSNHDPDDIHSIAALGCMLAHADYAGVNYFAVHGAYGDQNDSNFIPSPLLFTLVFGAEDDKWVNASPQDPSWNGAVAKIAAKVRPILDAGGTVWVAEAGQSDITADWVRKLIADGVTEAVIKSRVVVVQHSDWNEDHTTDADLTYTKNKCNYKTINDGNGTNTERDPSAPATPSYRSTNTTFQQEALSSQNKIALAIWKEAEWVINDENYFPSHSSITVGGVDFSDAVEAHWIFGAPTDYDTIRKFWDRCVVNVPSPNPEPEFPTGRDYGGGGEVTPSTGTWIEKDGMLVIEMEHGDLHEDWTVRPSTYLDDPTMAGSMGDGWIEWAGVEKFSTTLNDDQANGVSTFRFQITTAGDYTFRWRSKQYDDVEAGDAGNDTYIKFETGTPLEATGSKGNSYTITKFTKAWIQSQAAWSWGTNFEPAHGEFVTNPKVHYEAGLHEIRIAGRSKGHAVDRFVLYHSTANGTTAQSAPESERIIDTESHVYVAVTDFPTINSGEVNYYADNGNNALAINAATVSNRGKWARAELTFDGDTGTYDVALTALKELDGECSYRLYIDGTLIGEVQNDETTVDYEEQDHVFTKVNIPAGAIIAVESITDSNDKIEEGDGFAWARGRWRQLELTPNLNGTGLSVSTGGDQELYYPPVSAVLSGSASDDGTVVSTIWTQVSGPNTATLSGETTTTLNASNLIEGTYLFRLTATDDESNELSADATIVVDAEPPIIPTTSIWKDDFEGTMVVQPANTLTASVVDAPAAFTTASGKVALLSTGANSYSAIRASSAIDLSSYHFRAGDNYSISFDIYIPGDLAAVVGGVNFRWKDASNTGNGPTDTEFATLSAGVHRIEYTGTFPVTNGGTFMPTSVQPFIWFDQDGVALSDFVYLDNIDFKIWAPNYAPEFDVDPIDGGSVAASQSFSGNLNDYASDPNSDALTFSVVGPSWLDVAATGAMTGIPGDVDEGTNTFTVTAQDPAGETDSATLTIFVDEAPPRLAVTAIWEEDFDGVAIGTTSGNNATLAGTDIQTANTLSGEVVAAPAAFTSASGNVFLLSTLDNSYSAVRTPSAIDLSGYNILEDDVYTVSFDLYIPAALAKAVGDVQFRWNNINDTADTSDTTLVAGVHHIEYTGTFPVSVGIPTQVRPFIGFDQNGVAASEFVYMDNLKFEIGPAGGGVEKTPFEQYEENFKLSGGKMGDDDGDGQLNLIEFAMGGNPTNGAEKGEVSLIFNGDGNARFCVPQRKNPATAGIGYVVESCTNIAENSWAPLFTNAMFTNSIPNEAVVEEVQYRFWTGNGAATKRFIRLKVTEE